MYILLKYYINNIFMEFIKSLFNNSNVNLNKTEKEFSSDHFNRGTPIKIIEEQINVLMSISLSPLPGTKDDIVRQQSSIASCLKKIIFFFHLIL